MLALLLPPPPPPPLPPPQAAATMARANIRTNHRSERNFIDIDLLFGDGRPGSPPTAGRATFETAAMPGQCRAGQRPASGGKLACAVATSYLRSAHLPPISRGGLMGEPGPVDVNAAQDLKKRSSGRIVRHGFGGRS